MTVKELCEHFVDLPCSFALRDDNITEITSYSDRMEQLLDEYADSRVKEWYVGITTPSYFLHIVVDTKEETNDD